jgi:hypothetical protein
LPSLVGFLERKHHHVGIVDTNHNGKNFQYQLFGASSAEWMGYYIIDIMLVKLAGVAEMMIKDFASADLLLSLASLDTNTKLDGLSNIEDVILLACSTVLCQCKSVGF